MSAATRPAPRPGLPPSLTALRGRGVTQETVGQALEGRELPLVDGRTVTFIFRGEADGVAVEHRVVTLPAPLPMQRVPGTDVWYAAIDTPPGSRIEYRLLVHRHDSVENMLDPLNPRVARGPMSEMSVLEAAGYETPDWALYDRDVPQGAINELRMHSRALRREARITVYSPARAARGTRHPLLVMHDGGEFMEYEAIGVVLDNLMHRRLIADAFVALLHPRDRNREYAANPAHSRFLTDELVPELEATLPLRPDAGARVLLGASLGAVASLAAALRDPGRYGGLMLLSGSFRADLPQMPAAPPVLERTTRFVRRVQARPHWLTRRIFQTYGAFEPLVEANRAMTPYLRRMADEVPVFEALDGHSWTNWRDRMLDGLRFLLPPPTSLSTDLTEEQRAS